MTVGKIVKYGLYDSKKEYPATKETAPRTVKAFEFDYILTCSKNATSFIENEHCKLTPHTLVFRKPGEISHSILHYTCYCLHIEIAPDSSVFQELMKFPCYFFIIDKERYQTLFIDLFRHLVKDEQSAQSYYTSAKLLELVYFLKKDMQLNIQSKNYSLIKESLCVQKAVAFMKENFSHEISLEVLGGIVGYSPNHFRNVFSSIMKISPQKYLEKIRVDYAKFLLAKNEISIADIAYECGFSSQAYFSKIFKQVVLLTPNQFRQMSLFRYNNE